MIQSFVSSFRRMTGWSLLVSLLVLTLTVSACGGGSSSNSSTSSSLQSQASNSSMSSSSSSSTTAPAMGTLQVVKITEVVSTNGGKDQYSFTPDMLSVKAGDMVTVINQSDEMHTLMSTPADGIADGNMISKNEAQTIRFIQAGSFTISSAEHPDAKLAVTVGSASSALAPLTQVKIAEVVATNGGKDQYSFSPASVTVNNDTLVFVNQTDEDHTLMSSVDGGFADGIIISKNETQIIHFSKDGTYTISSMEHPEAKLTVLVK